MPRGIQRGLPGVQREEDDLPSDAVTCAVSGELLAERRRESMAKLRALLGDCPDGFAPEEWRVVVAAFAPAPAGSPGTASARLELLARASACFPGFAPPTASRLYREVLARPHVAAVLADLRAVELLDIVEQRGVVREALHSAVALHSALTLDLAATDPSGCAKLGLAVVAAAKALTELDGLRAKQDDEDNREGVVGGQDPRGALAEKMGAVFKDLATRSDAR